MEVPQGIMVCMRSGCYDTLKGSAPMFVGEGINPCMRVMRIDLNGGVCSGGGGRGGVWTMGSLGGAWETMDPPS